MASQLLLWLSAPSLMMEAELLARGSVIGILSVSLLRAYFHLKTPQYDPDRQRAIRQLRSTWRIMAMGIIACITLMLSSITAVPVGPVQEFVLGYCPIISFFVALKLQLHALGRIARSND